MVAVRRLGSPPIAEAVINLAWRLAAPITEDFESRLPPDFKAKYPVTHKLQVNALQVSFEACAAGEQPQPKTSHGSAFGGYRFESQDGQRVAILTGDSLILSHMKVYSSWENLLADAQEAWRALAPLAEAGTVHRLGLRYINRLALPLPADSKEFLPAGPVLPDELELGMTGFLSHVAVELPIDAQATVLQTLQHDVEGSTSVVIDVDIFRTGLSLPPEGQEIWERLGTFRDWKNRIFFAHVTEKLLEPYK